jgi:putative membrane protein
MGKTLVLCVDRDNDFGTKAGVESPVIGRRANLRAAIKLGIADPEDSDSNSLFAAIKAYDELKAKGEPVEIATVCGDPSVGDKSDHKISYQLGEIISRVQPESAIMVSDGPEDEFVLPLLKGKLQVREVRRVVVKQSERIEDTIYIIRKGMAKEEIRLYIITPLAFILLASGLLTITGTFTPQNMAYGIPAFGLGLLFLLQVLQARERAEEMYIELREGMLAARLSIFTSLIAFLFIFIGGAYSYQQTVSSGFPTAEEASLYFTAIFIWFIVPAIIIRLGGFFLDFWLRHKKAVWAYMYLALSWVAMVFLTGAGILLVRYFSGFLEGYGPDRIFNELMAYFAVTVGLAVGAALLYRYDREKKRVAGSLELAAEGH